MRGLSSRNGAQRSVVWLVAAAGLMATHLTAGAAPSTVGQRHTDVGTVTIRGVDGQNYVVNVELDVTAGEPSGAATAIVTYQACKPKNNKCGFTYSYGMALGSTEYSFPDKNTATVSTTLLGKALKLSWSGASGTTSYNGNVDNNEASFSDPTSGGPSTLTVQIFGVTCSGNGKVQNFYGAFGPPDSARTTGPSKVPSALVAAKHKKPACQSG